MIAEGYSVHTGLDAARLKSLMDAQGLTRAGLASRSGVSRTQLVRLLATRDKRPVRQGTVDRLARALQCDPIELAAGGKLKQFKQWVAMEHGYVDFRGLGMTDAQKDA